MLSEDRGEEGDNGSGEHSSTMDYNFSHVHFAIFPPFTKKITS